jgi:hypothetical protein
MTMCGSDAFSPAEIAEKAEKVGVAKAKEALIYCLRGRIAASRGARKLAYLHDMSRFLRAGFLALHPARRINQRFPNLPLLQTILLCLPALSSVLAPCISCW